MGDVVLFMLEEEDLLVVPGSLGTWQVGAAVAFGAGVDDPLSPLIKVTTMLMLGLEHLSFQHTSTVHATVPNMAVIG